MDDILNEVLAAVQRAEESKQKAVTKAKKVSKEKKKPETLEEAFDRILHMKLKDDERAIVMEVERLLRTGEAERVSDKKMSKKEVFEIYKAHEETVREQKKKYVLETKPDNFWIVQDAETLDKVREMLMLEPLTAWDTETTGLDLYNDRIVGYSAYLPNHDIAFYVPYGHTTGQQQVTKEEALSVAKEYLENPDNRTVWHHYKYDGHMFLNDDITVANPYWDTQVVAKILNEHESHRLKDLHAKYVMKGEKEAILFEDLFTDFIIYDKDIILSGIYAAGDAEKTLKLMLFQLPFIDERDNLKTVWYRVEQKLLDVDLTMERTGFRIDLDRMAELYEEFQPILEAAEKAIFEAFQINEGFMSIMSAAIGREETEFNINSPQHLAYLIYDHLGVDGDFGKKFKKGFRSTAADVVDALCRDHEELKPLLEYRKLKKLVSTYVEKIPQAMEPATGRLHSRFNNMAGDDGTSGAATGRYSSSEYCAAKHSRTGDHKKGTNLQNIPSKKEGVLVRKCFIPDQDWIFIGADLSQIEPRIISVILAEKYGDKAMQDFYKAGKDLYTEMAMSTFQYPRDYCVDGAYDPTHSFQPRKLMKQGVLAFLYGQSPRAFARTMKVSEEVAETFFTGMLASFPGLEPFRETVLRSLLTNGNIAHVETLFGRKRRFPEYRKNFAELKTLNKIPRNKITKDEQERRNYLWRMCASVERQAINTIIQGSAADVLKMNLYEAYKLCNERGYKLHASIHDEIILSVPKAELTPEVIGQVNRCMTKTVTFSTPLKTDIVIMERWMDEVKPNDWDFEKCQPKAA